MVKIVNLKVHNDHRGNLVAIESLKDVPFEIKRIYYLFNNSPSETRAKHAHKNLTQLYIAVSGKCKILIDDGNTKEYITLDNPNAGILFEKPTWREISDFSHDCVLLVLASDNFKKEDYIYNYEEFKKFISE